MRWNIDYHRAPLLLIWEVTRACELACKHCRASAENLRDPRELSLDQGRALLDQVADMGTPLVIFTGGDPLQRDDLELLIRHAKTRGLTAGAIPAATNRLTRERILSLRDAGVDQLALSIDGVTAAKHDEFRKVEGTYAKVMQAAEWIREAGVPLQINSVVGAWNFEDFDAMVDLVKSLGVVFWEVFFLVPTGRGADLQSCSAAQFEAIFNKLMALAPTVPFVIKVTEGQHLRRLAAERGGSAPNLMLGGRPVNAGHGFCFVDHTGEVNPSGFLPIPCGNLKEKPLAEIYRSHPVFVGLRDFTKLKGKCGICRYRDLCSGGSRSRAYAVGGDIHAPEPFCIYEPAPDETPLVVPSSPPAAHPVLRGHPQGARHPGPART